MNTRRTVTSFWQVNKQILYYMCIKINNEIQQIILVSWCFNILIFSNFIFIFLMFQYTNFYQFYRKKWAKVSTAPKSLVQVKRF